MSDDAAASRGHLGSRTKARKRAVDILFEADLRESDVAATLAERTADADPPVREYAAEIVRGVVAHHLAIDQRIAECLSSGWTLERMPRVDRAIARVATWEIDHGDVDAKVAASEAAKLAGELSTDESPAFLTGVLSTLISTRTERA